MIGIFRLKLALGRCTRTTIFRRGYHHGRSGFGRNFSWNTLHNPNTFGRRMSSISMAVSPLIRKSAMSKFVLLGSSGVGIALYFSPSGTCRIPSVVHAAAVESSEDKAIETVKAEATGPEKAIHAESENHCEEKEAANEGSNVDVKAKTVALKPDIWSWVLDAAMKDLLYYLLAAGCSIGMAVCLVLESRQFGEIYRIFSKGDGEIFGEMRSLIYLFVAEFTFSTLGSSLLAVATSRLGRNLRETYFISLIRQDMEFFDEKRQGEILTHVSQDISSICTSVRQVFTSGLRSVLTIVAGAVSMVMVSPKLAGGVFLVLPAMAGAGHLLGVGLQSLAKASNRANGMATSVVGEAVANIRTVKAYVSEKIEGEKFSKALDKAVYLKVKMGVAAGAFFGALHFGINGMQLLLCFIGSKLISTNSIDAGSMVTVTSQVMQLQRAFVSLSRTMTGLVRAMATCDGVYEVVLKEPRIEEKLEVQTGKASKKESLINSGGASVVFSDVNFYYPSRPKHQVLNGLSFKIDKGNVVALVGSSGCGKSTVGNLLERFYNPVDGAVYINGVDIKKVSPNDLRKQIGLVDQQPRLFATNIIENIRYGRPTASDEEVIKAAELANADEFIKSFPDGYETQLGEQGSQLSGGQRQRIAIARAILKDPSILILDEATSALDANSERQVQEALSRVMKGRTVLVIAHRLSTIIDSDLICVINRGKVVEKGDHQELMRMNGEYAKLFRKQQRNDR